MGERSIRIFAHCNVLCAGVCRRPLLCALMQQIITSCSSLAMVEQKNYGLVLACFSLSCNPGAVSLNCAAIHLESEKTHAVSSAPLKLPDAYLRNN